MTAPASIRVGRVTRSSTRVGRQVEDGTKAGVRWALEHGVPRQALRRAARAGDLQGRLVVESTRLPTAGLQPLFEEIRAAGPLVRTDFAHLTVDHAVVREVLSSNDFATGMRARGSDGLLNKISSWAASDILSPILPPSLLAVEPPEHTRYRKLVTRVFSVRAVEKLRTRTEQIAEQLLDRIDPTSSVDLVAEYCEPLPVRVIAEILGVPESEHQAVLRMGAGAAASLDLGVSWRTFRHVESALAEFEEWLGDHLARLRTDPGEDLMSQLAVAQDEGVGLTDRELRSTAGLVLAAGFETTVNLLSNAIALLQAAPEQRSLLREDPGLWPTAVDEALRLDPPVLLTARIAVRDTEVARHPVRAGQVVTTVLAGANRDPEVFADPTRFDVTRPNAGDHLSFSAGRHYCLGAALARMEGQVGLEALYRRFPHLTLLPGATHRPTRILRGYEALPARPSGYGTPSAR